MSEHDLDIVSIGLDSSRITERKKNADLLLNLLSNPNIIKCLNATNPRYKWDTLLYSTHQFLIKEGEKMNEDERNGKTTIVKNRVKAQFSGGVMTELISKANSGVPRLSGTKLIACILRGLDLTIVRKYFADYYIHILVKYVLPIKKYWADIEANKFIDLFSILKEIYITPVGVSKADIIEGLYLIVNSSHLHSSLAFNLRQEFNFIGTVCKDLNCNMSTNQQSFTIKLAISFCETLAKDCRMLCCKLGEELMSPIVGLYQSRYEDFGGIKSLIFEFVLLQIRLHHPKGCRETDNSAYAFNYDQWKKHLNSLYLIICKEINIILRIKPSGQISHLWPNFLELITEVLRQIFQANVVNNHDLSITIDESFPVSKRRKLDIGIASIITEIQQKHSWAWMEVLSKFINQYPDSIDTGDYINLLQILANLQTECKDSNTRHHLYSLLSSMVQNEHHLAPEFVDTTISDTQWAKVWETALRVVGLNQNEDSVHALLQSLLKYKKASQPSSLFNIYMSGALNNSIYSIDTLNTLFQNFTIPEMFVNGNEVISTRKYLINWILQVNEKNNNTIIFTTEITADVLVSLILKIWLNNEYNTKLSLRKYESIEDCYIISSLEGGIVFESHGDTENDDKKKIYLTHSEAFIELSETIQNYCSHLEETTSNIKDLTNFINFIILSLNLTSKMFDNGVLNEDNLIEFIDFEKLLKVFTEKCQLFLSTNENNRVNILLKIENIFSLHINKEISTIFRNNIPADFLKIFFEILNDDNVDETDENTRNISSSNYTDSFFNDEILKNNEKLSVISMNIIAKFCCFPMIETFNQMQNYALETIINDMDFNPHVIYEVQMTCRLLNALNSCKPGALSNPVLQFILNTVTKLLIAWQNDGDTVSYILKIIRKCFDHFETTDSVQLKQSFVDLLQPFFEKKSLAIRELIAFVNCLGRLMQVQHIEKWTLRSKEISLKLVEFLKHDFHEIRFIAIKNIVPIFNLQNTFISRILIFEHFCTSLKTSFIIGDNFTEDQKRSEVANRTVSLLQACASLIVSSPMWGKRALFLMLQLVNDCKLNTMVLKAMLSVIRKSLKITSEKEYLDMNMSYLISHWCDINYELKEFPFCLIGYQNSSEFFNDYINVVVPIMLMDNLELLRSVCKDTNKSIHDVIEESLPVVMAKFLPVFAYLQDKSLQTLSKKQIAAGERIQKRLIEIFTNDRLNELLLQKIDNVFIHFINNFFDCEHFKNQFGFSKQLPEPHPPFYDYEKFTYGVKYIENKFSTTQSLISYCLQENPQKLVNILLQITVDLQKIPTAEEKLKALHRYSILIDYIIPELQSHNNIRVFLIRSISYTLMNLVKENNNEIGMAACRYFLKFSSKCLPYCNTIFEKFLTLVISTLVPIAKLNTPLSEECVKLLNFLIVENSKLLYSSIGKLDPFPSEEKFEKIREVYKKIKYGNDTFTLEQEITHFLNAGNLIDVGCRLEGLTQLKSLLSKRKTELISLYAQLHNLRGFSEDCEKSILHQLLCMLVKLTSSTDPKISLEAARCLGELGPADLTTMVLKPEKNLPEGLKNPLELIAGQSITLLSKYLVDADVQVIVTATETMFAVLSSKEGKLVTKSHFQSDFGCGTLDLEYIAPFLAVKGMVDPKLGVDDVAFRNLIDNSEVWCPVTSCSHSEWIINLNCNMLQTFPKHSFLAALIPICKIKVEFAEHLFPLLVYLFIYYNNKTCTTILSKQIQNFFANHWITNLKNSLSQVSTSDVITQNRASVQCMLNVIHFVRLQQNSCKDRRIGELELNYLHVAQGAQFCSAHFTSILYAELWCYGKLDDKMIGSQSGLSSLDCICENEDQDITRVLQNILREGYKKVGDLDAVYGCGISYLLDTKSRIEHYKHLGRWDKVTLHYDSELSLNAQDSSRELLNSLKKSGLHYLACNIKNEFPDAMYESAWRLSNWDMPTSTPDNHWSTNEYEKCHYLALKSFHENDLTSMNQAIAQGRKLIIQSLSHASLESSKNLYTPLTQLQSLQEIESFVEAQGFLGVVNLIEKWKTCDLLNRNEFVYVEPIQAQRIIILQDVLRLNEDEDLKFCLAKMYLKLANEARIEGFTHIAQRALNNLPYIKNLNSEIKGRMMFQQAQLSWMDDKITGRFLLRHLLDNKPNPQLHASALKQYGSWMVETRSENPQMIIKKYFMKSLEMLKDHAQTKADLENKCESMDALARFADVQYQQVKSYMQSSVYESKVQTIERFRAMAQKIIQSGEHKKTQDYRRAIALYERQSTIDEIEVNNARIEKDMYLQLAVSHYIKLLIESDSYNLKVFRILSLCLSNKQNQEVIQVLKDSVDMIPTYKFIPLLPQLVPHIGNHYGQLDLFDEQVNRILERCMIDHPHHTLPIIMALADSYKDREFDTSNNGADSSENRVLSAKQLIAKYKKNPEIGPIIKNMELLSTALISLAYLPSEKCSRNKKQQIIIPSREKIKSIRNVQNVLVPTMNLDVRIDRNYSNIVGIKEFGNNFSLVGGVNEPKKIVCIGTDGKERTQLVKGKDDLRQDAVMQQVFTIMNTLLAKNKQTSKLLIRTYKVVPLSQRSGIIEWCENTEPLGEYLSNAHKKYHPSDWTPAQCRKQLKEVAGKDSNDLKFRVFQDICSNFRPVFHMFFISSYPQPTVWFERRRAYMHSVATSSMVGYILGLGDRHVQNILIDKSTAEVIHIDFGIAFEQGRVLPTPETVPFRLTRDIEAGMGICGIEGVFRRSCEKTMLVLRQNEETVLTILEVLLYDPLYAWTITAAEAYSRQKDDDLESSLKFSEGESSNTNITAERALLRLKQKLQGTENGGVSSVEGQVEQLLQEARDPVNLSRLYNGWQPYL